MPHDRLSDDQRVGGPELTRHADVTAEMIADVRALITRVGVVLAASEYERGRAAKAFERLSDAFARADANRRNPAMFEDRFVATYGDLRTATETLCRADRCAGYPPEHTVKMLKGLFDASATDLSVDAARVIEQDIVRWGIDAYYAA